MTSVESRVLEYLDANRESIAKFLQDYVSIPSVNTGIPGGGREYEAQVWLKEQLDGMGFDKVDMWSVDPEAKRPIVVATVKGDARGRNLIVNGHVDVVPVGEEERKKWNTDPFKGTRVGDRIYGRGTTDMKGGITAAIWAARAVIESGVRLHGDFYVEAVPGEESNEGGTIGTNATVDRGYTADFAIVAEPSMGEIHVCGPGVFLFELTVIGKEAHTGARNQVVFPQPYGIPCGMEVGVDAIEKARIFMDFFARLEVQWNQRWRHKLLGGGRYVSKDSQGVGFFTLNPSFIQGGTYVGAVPGFCKLTYNVWYPSNVDPEEIWEEIKRHVEAISSTDDWLRHNPPQVAVPVIQDWRPFETPLEHPGTRLLGHVYSEVTSKKPIYSGFRAVCDATYLNKRGIPSVVFGPGDISTRAHKANEYVDLDEVIECAKVYASMAVKWCGEGQA